MEDILSEMEGLLLASDGGAAPGAAAGAAQEGRCVAHHQGWRARDSGVEKVHDLFRSVSPLESGQSGWKMRRDLDSIAACERPLLGGRH